MVLALSLVILVVLSALAAFVRPKQLRVPRKTVGFAAKQDSSNHAIDACVGQEILYKKLRFGQANGHFARATVVGFGNSDRVMLRAGHPNNAPFTRPWSHIELQ